jgi:uncharacterized protein involved in exopolysaccharide biosynthesis
MIRLFDPEAPADPPRLTDGASASPRDSQSDRSRSRLDLMRSLRMHRGLALGFALVGLILAALYMVSYWSIYTAQSLVYIQPAPSAVMEAAPDHYNPATYDSYIQQQMLSMKRPDVLAGAVHKLAPGVWQQSGESDQSAADRLRGAIEVARVGSSHQVAITAHATDPDTAAALANAVAASYIENTANQQKASDAARLTMLKEEQERIRKELDDDRAEEAQLNAQIGAAVLGPKASQYYASDIGLIQAELVTARSEHDEAAARLTSIDSGGDLSSAALDADADQLISIDPGLSSLKQALLTRRAELVSHMSGTTPDDPQYMQDQEELEKIDASLESGTQDLRAQAAERIQEQLRSDLDRTASIEARLNGELAEMTRAAPGAAPKLQRSSDLANDIIRLQNRYNTVDQQLQNQALEDSALGSAHLAEAAVPPSHPAIAEVVRNALLLLFAFILLGLAAAVLAHKTDPHVYVASDASDASDAPDIDHLVGYGPKPHLPDVDEVSDEVAEEHLLRQPANVVPENRGAQSLPELAPAAPAPLREAVTPAPLREPSAPAALRDIEPVFPWFAGSASQPILKPPGPTMPATPTTEEPMSQPVSQAVPPPAKQLQEETPSWLMETPPWWMTRTHTYIEPAMELPRAPRVGTLHAAAAHGGQTPAVAEVRKKENVADEMPSRLSALRGIVFSLAIKEFSRKKAARRDGNDHGNGPLADATPSEPEQTTAPEGLAPRREIEPEHESAEAKVEETSPRPEVPRWVAAEPEFLAPPVEETDKGKESRWNPGSYDNGPDDLQILPSKPGQYKR